MTFTDLIEGVQGDFARIDLPFLHRDTESWDYHEKINLVVLMVLGLAMKYGDVVPGKKGEKPKQDNFSAKELRAIHKTLSKDSSMSRTLILPLIKKIEDMLEGQEYVRE